MLNSGLWETANDLYCYSLHRIDFFTVPLVLVESQNVMRKPVKGDPWSFRIEEFLYSSRERMIGWLGKLAILAVAIMVVGMW